MGVYKKAIITDAGEALRARAVAGEASMQFFHAKTSTYVYPDGTDLTKLTDLQEIRQTVIPSNVQIANDTLISVRSLFGNEQINEAYLIQNVGVYATDGENEILFAVCQAITPDQMPAYDGVAPSSFIYNVQLTVSQATQISLVVNTAGTATTQDVLELEQKKVNGNGGDISETVIAATEKSQAEYPVPAAGDSAKTVLGKVQKFFADIRNWMTGVCLLGQIVNNCVTDNAKLPLSAAQGKVLMDLYNVLNTKTSKTGHTHDDRYYTEKEIDAKLKKNLLIPSRYATSGTITTYQFTPQVCDQGILVICRSELYIIKLGQSNNVFNMCECIQVSNHTSVMNATASLGDDKKTVILKCKLYENPVLIGCFSA